MEQNALVKSSLMSLLRNVSVWLQIMTSMSISKLQFAVTFASLYTVVQDVTGKQSTIKMDRNILQRLITAYRAGREVNLDNILQHELMSVPLFLTTINGTLHSPNKSLLANILTKDLLTPPTISLD